MKIITIVSPDRMGLLADISYILGSARINIETLSAYAKCGKSIIGIGVKDERRATELLRSNGYEVLEPEMLIVRIKDEPAQMAQFTSMLSRHKIAIAAMLQIARDESYATFALKVDHAAKARKLLSQKGYLVDEKKR